MREGGRNGERDEEGNERRESEKERRRARDKEEGRERVCERLSPPSFIFWCHVTRHFLILEILIRRSII